MTGDAAKREKIIEKVRALLSMTTKNGCTEAEAMTAAAMASKLMEEYDLELSDVKSLENERIAQQSKPFASAERPREMHAAGIYVAVAVAEFFDCRCWRSYTEIIFCSYDWTDWNKGLSDEAILERLFKLSHERVARQTT